MGSELSDDAIFMIVRDIWPLPDRKIGEALTRCRRELCGKDGAPARLTTRAIFDRAGIVSTTDANEAMAIVAWEAALEYVKHHTRRTAEGDIEIGVTWRKSGPINPDCETCEGIGFKAPPQELENKYWQDYKAYKALPAEERIKATRPKRPVYTLCPCREVESIPAPELDQQMLDSIRRIGGWERLAEVDAENWTWIQRDFVKQYTTWTAVEAAAGRMPHAQIETLLRDLSKNKGLPESSVQK